MRPRRFYSGQEPVSGQIEISGDELFHLRNVMRGKPGDPVEIFDGKGTLYSGKIESIGRSNAAVRIVKKSSGSKPRGKIIIAPSLLKRKPMTLMVEKLTEMGVDEISPVIFSRTDAVYTAAAGKKWRKAALESLKVNDNLWTAEICEPCTPEELIERTKNIGNKILLDIEGERTSIQGRVPVICVIGPPGDYTPAERRLFLEAGFTPVNINESVMKVETAAFSALSILKYLSG